MTQAGLHIYVGLLAGFQMQENPLDRLPGQMGLLVVFCSHMGPLPGICNYLGLGKLTGCAA